MGQSKRRQRVSVRGERAIGAERARQKPSSPLEGTKEVEVPMHGSSQSVKRMSGVGGVAKAAKDDRAVGRPRETRAASHGAGSAAAEAQLPTVAWALPMQNAVRRQSNSRL